MTGRAKFAADMFLPGMLVGKILRSPHAHANIKSIDISAAEKLPGVKAVITRDDFPEIKAGTGRRRHDPQRHGAREGALRRPSGRGGGGDRESIAKQALKLIKVDTRCCRTSSIRSRR